MIYPNGTQVQIGDAVRFHGEEARVAFDVDGSGYSVDYPSSQWSYLKQGVMLEVPSMGLVHLTRADEDLEFIARAAR